MLERLAAHLDEGLPARTLDVEVPEGLDLLTTKPVIYVANVSEAGEPERVAALTAYATEHGAEVVAVAARFEAELAELEDPGRPRRVPRRPRPRRAGHAAPRARLLPHARPDHVLHRRARWRRAPGRCARARSAVEAAGKIHSDIARGFIRAEVIRWDDLVAAGSHTEAQKRGVQRVEGKEYVVVDGDVLNIRFNV